MTLLETEKYFARRIVNFYRNELTYFRDAKAVDHSRVLEWVNHYLGVEDPVVTEDRQLPLFTAEEDAAI